MPDYPETNASLIAGIQDRDNTAAWSEFERLYRPIIFRVARAKGMQHADAFDLVQQVLMSVATAIPKYESREDGPPFRNWLSRITHNAILKALTRQPRDQAGGGTWFHDLMIEVHDKDEETNSMIQMEYRRELFRIAAEKVRAEVQVPTWLAFETTVIHGLSIESAANKLSMSLGNVYAARSRVMRRLRRIVSQMETQDSSR